MKANQTKNMYSYRHERQYAKEQYGQESSISRIRLDATDGYIAQEDHGNKKDK